MEIVAEFDTAKLKAMAHAVAHKDIREYLNNVRLQRDKKGTYLIASDACVVVVRKVGPGSKYSLEAEIPISHIKQLPVKGTVSIELVESGPVLVNGYTRVPLENRLEVICRYIDWRRCVPDTAVMTPESGDRPVLDPFLVDKAARAFGPELAQLKPHNRGQHVFTLIGKVDQVYGVVVMDPRLLGAGDVFALVAPVNTRPDQWKKPGWA